MKKILIIILILCIGATDYLTYDFFSKEHYITSEEAIEIAENDVSNKENEYTHLSTEFKETNGTYIYTLEFKDKINTYVYKINAKTKKIISTKKYTLNSEKDYMNEDDILNIVFKNAKLDPKNCNLISNLVTIEGGIPIYNTIFYYNNTKYEYKVNGLTGSIISISKLNENAV